MQMPDTRLLDPAHAFMKRAAIVPDNDIAKPPFVNIHMLGPLLNGEELLQ